MASTSPTLAHLEAALDGIRRSPVDDGKLELIVRRRAEDQRESLAEGTSTSTWASWGIGGAGIRGLGLCFLPPTTATRSSP